MQPAMRRKTADPYWVLRPLHVAARGPARWTTQTCPQHAAEGSKERGEDAGRQHRRVIGHARPVRDHDQRRGGDAGKEAEDVGDGAAGSAVAGLVHDEIGGSAASNATDTMVRPGATSTKRLA